MLTIILSTVLTFPLLLLLSIPLAFTAVITIFLAVFALLLRASLAYFDYFFNLAWNYFLNHPSSAISNAPPSRTQAYGLRSLHQYRHQYHFESISPGHSPTLYGPKGPASSDGPGRRGTQTPRTTEHSANSGKTYGYKTALPSPTAFQSFINGGLDRDFEGVGGWRDLSGPVHHHHLRRPTSGSTSSSSSTALYDEEADDRAWLSMNQRLELPSLSRRRSSGASGR